MCGVVFLFPNKEVYDMSLYFHPASKKMFIFKTTWAEANKYCCERGMNQITVQNLNKQNCLYNLGDLFLNYLLVPMTENQKKTGQEKTFAGKELWTAGRDVRQCPGKFRWCATKLRDFFKGNLLWKNGIPDLNNSCVFIDTKQDLQNPFDGPKLVATNCDQKKYFACEVILVIIIAD
jgi:hypothetical protein